MIIPMLEISTAHITLETNTWLHTSPHSLDILRDPYFTIILVPSDHTDDLSIPDELRRIFDYAQDQHEDGIHFVKLDCDGEVVPELPTYNW